MSKKDKEVNGVVKNSHNMKFPESMDEDLKDVNIKINDTTIDVCNNSGDFLIFFSSRRRMRDV